MPLLILQIAFYAFLLPFFLKLKYRQSVVYKNEIAGNNYWNLPSFSAILAVRVNPERAWHVLLF